MKKVTLYLFFVIIFGGAFVSYWVWQKYFKPVENEPIIFTVQRGNIDELIKVRGEAASQKDYDLEFPFSGTVESVYVKEGDVVSSGAPLMKLETTDFDLELQRLRAVLNQQEISVQKLIAGATQEDLKLSETKVQNAQISFNESASNLSDKIQGSYFLSDDAIRNRVDQIFNNPHSANPRLNFLPVDTNIVSMVESQRLVVENILNSWQSKINSSTSSNIQASANESKSNLATIQNFLDNVALAVNSATPNSTLTQTTIDGWKSDVYTARSNINTATANILTAEEKWKAAQSALSLAKDELAYKKAGTRQEDIAIARSATDETKSQIRTVEEKIKKSTLFAPASAEVSKIYLERKETFSPGKKVILLSMLSQKVQADVSELDIGKICITDSNDVKITFDAFPEKTLTGRVVSVDPKEIIKETDKYYRVNIQFDSEGEAIRPAMSADLVIRVSSKKNILHIPEIAVYEKGGKKYTLVLRGNQQVEIEIATGISNGDQIEVLQGLSDGDTILVAPE